MQMSTSAPFERDLNREIREYEFGGGAGALGGHHDVVGGDSGAVGTQGAPGDRGGPGTEGRTRSVRSDSLLASGSPNLGADRDSDVWRVLGSVPDPEIPVLTVVDLGIVRYVKWTNVADGKPILHVGITPTYSGCPATEVIRQSIRMTLERNGYTESVIEEVLFPAWTSDWLSDTGRQKLVSFGIAPPERSVSSPRHLFHAPIVACPRCASRATERVSEFGSTPCKAHYRCTACLEPFDYFKCL
jgi:ring-1,2-phenylacetyl-CoA epoxidase subunit PaaD